MRDFGIKLVASFFFTGYFPWAPATFASLITLLLWLGLQPIPAAWLIGTLVFLSALGTWAAHRAESFYGHDGRPIVIDEVVGVLLTIAFVPGDPVRLALAGFLLFRVLDVVKPPPAYQLQSLRGGLGVMADDIMAGIYGNLILQVVARLWPGLLRS